MNCPSDGGLPDHISASQIETFRRCPWQWWFRYVEGIRRPPSGAQTQGRVLHQTIERNYLTKRETYEDEPVDDLREYYAAAFDAAIEETDERDRPDAGALLDTGVAAVSGWHAVIAPHVQPIYVEQRWEMPLSDGSTLLGILDVVDEQGCVRDNKLAARRQSPERSLQLSLYGALYRHHHAAGILPAGYALDCVIKRASGGVAAEIVPGERRPEEIDRAVQFAEITRAAMVRYVQAGEIDYYAPRPANSPQDWYCNERFCGYWGECPQGDG